MNRLNPVSPEQLGEVWPRLRAPLMEMDRADGWLPEDVYCTLRTGGASLYLVEVEGDEAGFLVLRVINDFDGRRLHIWILHADSDVDVMALFSDELDRMAGTVGASTLTFGTTRRGWAKVAPRYHFSVRETVYQRKIKP